MSGSEPNKDKDRLTEQPLGKIHATGPLRNHKAGQTQLGPSADSLRDFGTRPRETALVRQILQPSSWWVDEKTLVASTLLDGSLLRHKAAERCESTVG